MDLYILRHAIAGVWSNTFPGGDSQRPLTVEGAEKMRLI
jgi:phosphohistidine phosphatase SixA